MFRIVLAISTGGTHDVDMKEVTSTKEGRLNTKDCLHALALLRRAKWFQVILIKFPYFTPH